MDETPEPDAKSAAEAQPASDSKPAGDSRRERSSFLTWPGQSGDRVATFPADDSGYSESFVKADDARPTGGETAWQNALRNRTEAGIEHVDGHGKPDCLRGRAEIGKGNIAVGLGCCHPSNKGSLESNLCPNLAEDQEQGEGLYLIFAGYAGKDGLEWYLHRQQENQDSAETRSHKASDAAQKAPKETKSGTSGKATT